MNEKGLKNKNQFSIDEFKELMTNVGRELNDNTCIYASNFFAQ